MQNVIRSRLGVLYFLIFSILIVLVVIKFASLNIDPQEYFTYLRKTNTNLLNENIAKLLNADTLENLPNITLVSDNTEIEALKKCKDGAIFMGPLVEENSYLKQCKKKCGSNGVIIDINIETEYYSNGLKLTEGSWCILNSVSCNPKTSYVVATVNSTVCKSKYPNMFGGPSGNNVIACNNEYYPATGSILWDNLKNEPIDPLTINMSHEDETLSDGSFRFSCQFNEDINQNKYIAHPLNRFQPIRDPCKNTIHKASPEVKAVINSTDWFCECGNYMETRVRNIDLGNTKSTCTNCLMKKLDPTTNTITIPFTCFTLKSSYKDAKEMLPCISSKFTRHGNQCMTMDLHIKEITETMFEHVKGVRDMPFSGITLKYTDFQFNIDRKLN